MGLRGCFNKLTGFCRFVVLLSCAVPPVVCACIWQYGIADSRFGLLPAALHFAGFSRIPRVTFAVQSNLFVFWFTTLFFVACGILVVAVSVKHCLAGIRAVASVLVITWGAAVLAVMFRLLLFSFSLRHDMLARRFSFPPVLMAYGTMLNYGFGRALQNSALYASLSALVAAVFFIPVKSAFTHLSPRASTVLTILAVIIPGVFFCVPGLSGLLNELPFFVRLTNTRIGRTLIYALLVVPPVLVLYVRLHRGLRLVIPTVFIAVWNDFVLSAAFVQTDERLATVWQVLLSFEKKLRYTGNWPEFFAALTLCSLPPFVAAACWYYAEISYRTMRRIHDNGTF